MAVDARKRKTLRTKLVVVGVLLSLVPMLVATGISYYFAHASLEKAAFDRLVAVRDAKADEIRAYFGHIAAQVETLAHNRMTVRALEGFARAFQQLPHDLEWSGSNGAAGGALARAAAERTLRAHYLEELGARFGAQGGAKINPETLFPTSDATLAAQHLYISSNPRGFGSKHLLDVPAGDTTSYGALHAELHPAFREFLERFGYHDIFLVDAATKHVVYTVYKEVDFGTSIEDGPYKDSGLAEVCRKALASNASDSSFVVDFEPYTPSLGKPAAFIAAPVRDQGAVVGALAFQMPIDRINAMMTHRSGLGETGEIFLVGTDRKMRSDSRFSEESTILERTVDTSAVREALDGNTGQLVCVDYRGEEVLAAYAPLDAIGMHYALVAEIETHEAFAEIGNLFRWMLGLAAVLAVLSVIVSFRMAASLAAPVSVATEHLQAVAERLLSTSQEQQAGAAEQSSAVEETRQTFEGLLQASGRMSGIGSEVLDHAQIGQNSAQTIGTRIHELSSHTAHISEVLTLVNDIANKSEILALNAALEGTKAGEAGRGFSLVATQMQRLAEQVMGSVKKIEGLTSDISKASQGAVLAAEEAEKVAGMTTASAREIADAVSLQRSSTEQVSIAMDEISQVAQGNVGAARNIVSASNELLTLAEDLRAIVGARG